MGRKMKATKSGKFINPTDRERKEARKRELRKNKKQRLIVRTAVLKGKDPFQILSDMERLDKMEYDINQSAMLNEKVLKDKRRKLKETWDRLCRLYVKDDRDKFLELKRLEAEYEGKRHQMMKEFEAVKSAQEVSLEDIPLPTLPMEMPSLPSSSSDTPAAGSILKHANQLSKKLPPGCPQGLPPLLREFEIPNGESEDEEEVELGSPRKKIRFADEEPKKDKESNLKDFLKEIEQITGDKEDEQQPNADTTGDGGKSDEIGVVPLLPPAAIAAAAGSLPPIIAPPPLIPGARPPIQPAPPVVTMLPPPPGMNLPPMAPALRPPPPFIGVPPRLGPPLMPPRGNRPMLAPPGQMRPPNAPHHHQQQQMPPLSSGTIPIPSSYAAVNYLRNPEERSKSQVTTIEAKPQLRNLAADSTRFMPLALRVKRDEKQQQAAKKAPKTIVGYGMVNHNATSSVAASPSTLNNGNGQKNSKDDAYSQFMKEMSGFM